MSGGARAAWVLPAWRKSTHSGVGNQCVEVTGARSGILVRDSRRPDGVRLQVTRTAWAAMIDKIKNI